MGAPMAGRVTAETEGLIGCFANTLVMRTDVSGEPTFGELLARVRGTVLGAYAHADVPFERSWRRCSPSARAGPPLFQVTLVLNNPPALTDEFPDRVPGADVQRGTSKFDPYAHRHRRAEQLVGSSESTPTSSTTRPSSAWPGTSCDLLRRGRGRRRTARLGAADVDDQPKTATGRDGARVPAAPLRAPPVREAGGERTPAIAVVGERERTDLQELNQRSEPARAPPARGRGRAGGARRALGLERSA